MGGDVLGRLIERAGDIGGKRVGLVGDMRPVAGEDIVGAPPEQQIERRREKFAHCFRDGVIPVGGGPTAEAKAAAAVFVLPAGRLHHAVEADERAGNNLSHGCLLQLSAS